MALAMQQALALFPSHAHMVHTLELQTWWRAGIQVVSKAYLSDQTWELTVVYEGASYAVVYDVLTDECNSIEPHRPMQLD